MKRFIKSSTTSDRFSRRIIKNIAEEIIREHGENNSIGTYDSFIRTMMDRWGTPNGHDRDFIHHVITKAFEEEFSVKSSTSIKCSEEYDSPTYMVVIEERDSDGDVYNTDYVYESSDKELAIEKAKQFRNQYDTVTIEVWYGDDFSETIMEYEY